METLQAALDRAVERRNLELFSPVGATRQIAVETLRRVIDAVLAGDSATAGELLEQVQPEAPEDTTATVSSQLHRHRPWGCSTTHSQQPAFRTSHYRLGIGAVSGQRRTSSP